jgi:hypothetical protein
VERRDKDVTALIVTSHGPSRILEMKGDENEIIESIFGKSSLVGHRAAHG